MKIVTCYTVPIKKQMVPVDKKGASFECRMVDDHLMRSTATECFEALKLCVDIYLKEWDYIKTFPVTAKTGDPGRKRIADILIHSTNDNIAKYPEFDEKFPDMQSNTRRSIISDALGKVSSYISNHENWEKLSPSERGEEPKLGLPDRYELTFYKDDRQLCSLKDGIVGLKLFDGKIWDWHYFKISPSDAKYISAMCSSRKMLSPVVKKRSW